MNDAEKVSISLALFSGGWGRQFAFYVAALLLIPFALRAIHELRCSEPKRIVGARKEERILRKSNKDLEATATRPNKDLISCYCLLPARTASSRLVLFQRGYEVSGFALLFLTTAINNK